MNKILLIAASLFFMGCTSAHAKHTETVVVVHKAPVTVKVWVDGAWVRHGHSMHWVAGHWAALPPPVRPHAYSKWIPGHYNRHGKWIPGHWNRR